ncbi:MazG-like family protein [Streptomyces sp. NPDC048172]|uniref:MazG-like family protein n=1 Tax=Streptomyces sp. NPDC048172 TaxID=3365505 RepID=UPI0037124D9F
MSERHNTPLWLLRAENTRLRNELEAQREAVAYPEEQEEYPGELGHLRRLLHSVARLSRGEAEDGPLVDLLIDHYSDPDMVDATLAAQAPDHAADIAHVLGDDVRVRTDEVRQRLAAMNPGEYRGWTARDLTRVLKELGTPPYKSNGLMVVSGIAVLGALEARDRDGTTARPDTEHPATDLFEHSGNIAAWLDLHNGRDPHEVSMRLLKVTEEAGEAAQAYLGSQGQNPRKGHSHTEDDVAHELCDVILAAAVALWDHTQDPAALLADTIRQRAARLAQRMDNEPIPFTPAPAAEFGEAA